MRAEHAGEPGLPGRGAQRQGAGGAQPGQRVQRPVLVVRQHPAHVRLLRYPGPVRGGCRAQPRGGIDGRVGAFQRRLHVRVLARVAVQPELEAVVHGHLERAVHQDVLQPGAGFGQGGHRDRATRLGLQRGEDGHRQVPGDIPGLHLPLQPDEDPPVRLDQRRHRHRQHGGHRDRALAVPLHQVGDQPQRRRRGRDEFPQRDPLRFVHQAGEGPGHEDVAQLLALGR